MKKKKVTHYQIRRVVAIVVLMVLCLIVGYSSGYGKGVIDSWTLIAENVEDLIDMKLTPRAKMVLTGQPDLLRLILTPETLEKHFEGYMLGAINKGGLGPEAVGKLKLEIINLTNNG